MIYRQLRRKTLSERAYHELGERLELAGEGKVIVGSPK